MNERIFIEIAIIIPSWWGFGRFLMSLSYIPGSYFIKVYNVSVSVIIKIIHVNENKNKDNYEYYIATGKMFMKLMRKKNHNRVASAL